MIHKLFWPSFFARSNATFDQRLMRAVAAGSTIEGLEHRLLLSASDLDNTFGDGGRTVAIFGDTSQFNDVVLLSDGKILAVGTIGTIVEPGSDSPLIASDSLVARYNADGSLDTTFGGGDGWVSTDFTPEGVIDAAGYGDVANAVALLPDGDFVVVGESRGIQFTLNAAVARYNADGSLDTGFSSDGKVLTEVPGNTGATLNSRANAVTITPAGKILVAGDSFARAEPENFESRFTLVRYNANGTLDSAFGDDGITTTQYIYFEQEVAPGVINRYPSRMVATDIQVLPNGKLLVGGTADVAFDFGISQQSFALARYSADGVLDETFGEDGWVTAVDGNGTTGNFVVRPDGDIVLVGSRSDSFFGDLALSRYTSAGVRDRSFGPDGSGTVIVPFTHAEETTPDTPSPSFGQSVVALPNGQLIAVGYVERIASSETVPRLVIARFSDDGVLDTSYATGGKLQADFLSRGQAAVLQPDGKLVVVGGSGESNDAQQAGVIRFEPQGTGSVAGTIYNDANENGVNDAGDTPLAGWTAYADFNNNSQLDANEPFAISGADGGYSITGLPAGNYRIRELRESGYNRTQPAGAWPMGYYDLTLSEGQASAANDFGNFEPSPGSPSSNTGPVAAADTAETSQDTPVEIDVLANDADDSGLIGGSVTLTSGPASGTATVNPVTGAITYLPAAGFSGTDTFAYSVADDQGVTSTATTVTVTVTAATLSGTIDAALPSAAVAGQKARGTVKVGVQNQTPDQVKGKVNVALYLSEDGVLDDADALVSEKQANLKVNAGKVKNVSLKLKNLPTVGADTYQFLTQVTSPDGSVAVLPAGSVTVTSPFVDLVPATAAVPAVPLTIGKNQKLSLNIANNGNISANGSVLLELFATTDETLDDNDVLLASVQTRVKIREGGSQRKTIRFTVPNDLPAGSYRLMAQVNSDGAIVERNAQNNSTITDPLAVQA